VERFALRDKISVGQRKPSFSTMLGYQAFAIEVILNSGRCVAGCESLSDPWCSSTQNECVSAWQAGARKGFPVLLAPARERIAVEAKAGIAPEFAHDERLVVL